MGALGSVVELVALRTSQAPIFSVQGANGRRTRPLSRKIFASALLLPSTNRHHAPLKHA